MLASSRPPPLALLERQRQLVARQRLLELPVERLLVVLEPADADRIERAQLASRVHRVRKEVELDGRRRGHRQLRIVERGRLDLALRAERPVLAERLDDEPVEVPLASFDFHRFVFVEIELLGLVIDLAAERNLPVRRDPVRADARAELSLRLDSSPSNEAEPWRLKTQLSQRSPVTAGRCCSEPSFTSIVKPWRHRLPGQEPQQTGAHRRSPAAGGRCRRCPSSPVTVLSVSVTSWNRPRPMKASVYSPAAARRSRARVMSTCTSASVRSRT